MWGTGRATCQRLLLGRLAERESAWLSCPPWSTPCTQCGAPPALHTRHVRPSGRASHAATRRPPRAAPHPGTAAARFATVRSYPAAARAPH
eukprot:365872-Chlamydomonas_euryale.AAC.4